MFVLAASPRDGFATDSARIKDIARVQGARTHALVGYGIVTGLAGTGDSQNNQATRQTIANLLAQFNLTLPSTSIMSRNVAIVLVSAELPNYARQGDSIDVTVASMGDAKSLVGGNLLVTPLKAPNGQTYVLAQGALTVGGYTYEANGTLGQKNHPTVATIPGGGLIEVAPPAPELARTDTFAISLLDPDYTNAARIADVINGSLGAGAAQARDPNTVDVRIPELYRDRSVELIRKIESLEIAPDYRARVVVNERTGTVVSGANVLISQAVITSGDLKISITTDNSVSQPNLAGAILVPGAAALPGASSAVPVGATPVQGRNAIRTLRVANSRINLQEPDGATLVSQDGGTIADLVVALSRLHVSARDVVSILKELKTAGVLHAELIVQ
jgi:flagellar P-ring protein precursor FlgI